MNRSTALAVVLVDEMVRCGIRHAVLCPGSRSAPLAYALEAADRAGLLRLHVRVDERSAGFLALGLAKLSRVPAAVVTTSGTAVANLHPAVLEAAHADVPLVVLSADRPAELLGTGANQTTTQPGIFGSSVRWSVTVTAAEDPVAQHAWWRSTVCRGWAAATGALGGRPGPVHLDIQLRDPLVPDPGDLDPGPFTQWPDGLPAGRAAGAPWTATSADPTAAPGVVPGSFGPSDAPERTLVLIGDLPEPGQVAEAVRWAVARGWPVITEPFGGLDRSLVVPSGSLLLTDHVWLERHRPERVVTVGRLTLSRHVASLVRRDGVRVETVAPHPDWTDPSHRVAAAYPWSVVGSPVGTVGGSPVTGTAMEPAAPPPAAERTWRTEWQAAGGRLAGVGTVWPTGLQVASTLLRSLPPHAVLFAASSNAARDLDLAPVPPAEVTDGLRVTASRGLAGIDGCLATPIGLSLAGQAPTYALVGDLAFVHDAGALAIGPGEPRPDLTVVVVNDQGGGIFSLLEPGDPQRADLVDRFARIFTTPTGTDLAALCRAHGVDHRLAASAPALAAAVAEVPRGLRVVEVRLDPQSHRAAHERLRESAAALGSGGSVTTE